MNPNSEHQLWSRWTFTVMPGTIRNRPFNEVCDNCARFARKAFGSAGEMKVVRTGDGYTIDIRVEGHPVHDARFVAYYAHMFRRFFESGFGVGTTMTLDARLEAGSRQDGTPPDQLLILPSLSVN